MMTHRMNCAIYIGRPCSCGYAEPNWPTNADGTPKRMGELTKAQQQEQFSAAVQRLQPKLAREGIRLVEGDGKQPH